SVSLDMATRTRPVESRMAEKKRMARPAGMEASLRRGGRGEVRPGVYSPSIEGAAGDCNRNSDAFQSRYVPDSRPRLFEQVGGAAPEFAAHAGHGLQLPRVDAAFRIEHFIGDVHGQHFADHQVGRDGPGAARNDLPHAA